MNRWLKSEKRVKREWSNEAGSIYGGTDYSIADIENLEVRWIWSRLFYLGSVEKRFYTLLTRYPLQDIWEGRKQLVEFSVGSISQLCLKM